MTHARAVWTMVAVTAMWSIAGVVTRLLESAHSFEVTFWRSLFTALSLVVWLSWTQGRGACTRLLSAPHVLWLSGVCWAFMFTAFMMALTMARVAEVLVTMALGPLLTALIARLVFSQGIARRTWCAIAAAGVGMVWMFAEPSAAGSTNAAMPWGSFIALLVPLSAAINWSLVRNAQAQGQDIDLVPAVCIGAVLSALATLPLAWPLQASAHDVAWLAVLGVVQLAIPCALVVVCARVLPASDISLLALLEVLFGIVLAWVGAGEEPSPRVLSGGALVLAALLFNEWLAKREALTEYELQGKTKP